MTRWAMLADLERCVGCQTCTAACRHANATSPAVQWRKVLDIEAGAFPNVNRTFVMASRSGGRDLVQRPFFYGAPGNKGHIWVHAIRTRILKQEDVRATHRRSDRSIRRTTEP